MFLQIYTFNIAKAKYSGSSKYRKVDYTNYKPKTNIDLDDFIGLFIKKYNEDEEYQKKIMRLYENKNSKIDILPNGIDKYCVYQNGPKYAHIDVSLHNNHVKSYYKINDKYALYVDKVKNKVMFGDKGCYKSICIGLLNELRHKLI